MTMLRPLILLVSLVSVLSPGCGKDSSSSAPSDCAGGYECPDRVSDCSPPNAGRLSTSAFSSKTASVICACGP